MNITQSNLDELNALLAITIEKEDYQPKVTQTLKDYRKNANVPGFRKGQVPMSLIKKQYEKALIYEEVNKMLQENINKHLNDNNVAILGNPLPKENADFDWDADVLNFEFELGLAPEFEVSLDSLEVPYHKIVVGDEEVEKYIQNFRQRYGKMSDAETVAAQTYVKGAFVQLDENNEVVEDGIANEEATLEFDSLLQKDLFEGKKNGDVVVLSSKNIYEKDSDVAYALGITASEVENLDVQLQFTIENITQLELAELDQELFDKIYGEGTVDSEEAFRAKIKEEAEKMYVKETDKQLLNDVFEKLLANTQIDLPAEFLKKWLLFNNEEVKTEQDAEEQFEKSEKGLKYQLIESKLAEKYELKLTQEDMKNEAIAAFKEQMAMYGAMNFGEEQINQIALSSLEDEQQRTRIADRAFSQKMLEVFKEKVNMNTQELSFEDFVAKVTEAQEQPA